MSVVIKSESSLPNGLVRRRYTVTIADLLGESHTEVLGMFNHEPSNDGASVEADFLSSKKAQEIEQYKADIEGGVNPFVASELRWNSRAEMLKAVLDAALSLQATDAMVYNGLPYLSQVSDSELMSLYNESQEWVDSIRLKVDELLVATTIIDNYRAVL